MMETEKYYNIKSPGIQRSTFHPPEIPVREWCDFRKDYELGMTFVEIGKKYFCDPRTVKTCILQNKPSNMLGRQSVPTKLAFYYEFIDEYLNHLNAGTTSSQPSGRSICSISRDIFLLVREKGYTGCERTVRNYINTRLPSKAILKKEDQRND